MTKKRHTAAGGKLSVGRDLWAYGYEMIAPHPESRIADIRGLLERRNAAAVEEGITWTARLVTTRQVHVLIVSESPEPDLDINRTLEAELAQLGVQFLMTAPMLVSDDAGTQT